MAKRIAAKPNREIALLWCTPRLLTVKATIDPAKISQNLLKLKKKFRSEFSLHAHSENEKLSKNNNTIIKNPKDLPILKVKKSKGGKNR